MAILGLLLLAAAAVFGVETALSNRTLTGDVEAFQRTAPATVTEVFLIGAATAAVALLGLYLIFGAMRRRHRRTVTERDAKWREETTGRMSSLEETNRGLTEENDRLRTELNERRRAEATMGGVAVPPGVGDVPYGDQVSDAVRSDTISDTGRFEPYPVEHGNDGAVNVEAGRHRADGHEKAGILGRFRGNS